ncbi:hypothetical protein IWX90DRAFT_8912 [Phyllosticta citrichinensis]|uniref:Uncharacterized protein n=1 Tax=Phyllosticta citrichinensis TaxID=1130410 RepID=A0ABR1Y694_9PEZI
MCRMAKHALPTDESEQRAPKRPSSGDEAMTYRPVRRPQKNNEWWSVSENYFAAMDHDTQVKWSHIGRILETAQGRQMDAPCERCRENGTECWAYSDDPANDDAGFGCAECRLRQDWQESCTLNPNCRAGDDPAASEVLTINTATLGKLASRLAAMERQISVLRKENDNIWQVNNTLRQQLEELDIKKVTPVIMKPPASTQQVTALEEQNKNIQEENTGLKQRLEELEAKQDATQKMLHATSCTVE